MAGGNIQAACKFLGQDIGRQRRCRGVSVAEQAGDAVRGQDFPRDSGKMLAKKPSVISKNDPLLSDLLLAKMLCDTLGDDLDISDRKVIRDLGPPSRCAERNRTHWNKASDYCGAKTKPFQG